ncbi:hypothetical protein K443DRAFT_135137 [Laccaria amethystina LaAM-08-1]|uniref:Uncharacterized protein n=1 Tax=Laccaria amethystina LaAM-08-1 TaxID=1095629 RepID=A0A0C9X5X1_9AGAR|nr:hypothetical protein K443DRAFT_135137 [Laccaria amethystina LaAM-08-1]
MGRQRLYHTPEEKLQADRTKSKKHYGANRVRICRRSRRQYKKKVEAIRKKKLKELLEGSDDNSEIRADPLSVIADARERVNRVTKGAIYTYVDNLVLRSIELCAFRENWWRELMDAVHDALGGILQEYGCGAVYQKADLVGRDVRHVVTLVEEIHTHAVSMSPKQMEDWHSSGIFSYQICAEGANVSI